MKIIIHRKVLISMLFIAITLLGIVSYNHLSVELYPSAELPVLYVQINSTTGQEPKYVEQEVVIPIEGVIGTLEGVEKMESVVNMGRANIIVYLSKQVNYKYAYLKLSEKINAASSSLPEGFFASVVKVDTEQISGDFMQLQVLGSGGVDRIRKVVEDDIKVKLEGVEGVAGVNVYGGRPKSVEIIFNKSKLDALGITVAEIRNKINRNTIKKEFAGRVKSNNSQYMFVNISAEYTSTEEIENIVIRKQGPVLLSDVADVVFGVKEQTSYSRINGKESVTINITSEASINRIEVAHSVLDEINNLNKELKHKDIEIKVNSNTSKIMEDNISKIIDLALIGSLLAVFILWIFLRNIPLASVVMLSIPISVFAAFNIFYAFDISINMLTLIGIALAIGMLIDNSIVVMENIYHKVSYTNKNDEAVTKGTKEVWRAILASTLTTITVFVPFIFSDNALFKLVSRNISVSIVGTLLVSLAVALLLIPMMVHTILISSKVKVKNQFHKFPLHNLFVQYYIVLLKFALRKPARTINIAVITFFMSIFISLAISYNVKREIETPEFVIELERPEGSTLEATDEVIRKIEDKLAEIKEGEKIISQVYDNRGSVTFQLKEDYKDIKNRDLPKIKSEIYEFLWTLNTGFLLSQGGVARGNNGSIGSNPGMAMLGMFGIGKQEESIVIKGDDFEKMVVLADEIKSFLKENIEEIQNIWFGSGSGRPEVHLLFNHGLMGLYGINSNDVASELRVFRPVVKSGGVLKIENDNYDIILRELGEKKDDKPAMKTYSDLANLNIPLDSGRVVPLHSISEITYEYGKAKIRRVNRQKEITIRFWFKRDVSESKEQLQITRNKIDKLMEEVYVPVGTAIEIIHEKDEFNEFYFFIGVAFLLILMILSSIFESFITPFVMLFSIPLAAIGSLFGLIITGNSLLSLNTLIGFIILLGIVVNNGIILIDYSNMLRKKGMSHSRALIQAGISRVRPILITASTTVVAMLPLALGKSEYVGSLGAPFAITVIGGLSVSTLLTLVFIPAFSFGTEKSLIWIKSLKLPYKLIIFALWIIGFVLIQFVWKHDFAWKLLEYFITIVGVPAVMFFVLTSLRRANTSLISDDEPINIALQHIVKVYQSESKFVREWKTGTKFGEKERLKHGVKSFKENLIWQIPIFVFLQWMTWIYLESSFWSFIFILISYFVILSFLKNIGKYIIKSFATDKIIYKSVMWLFPIISVVFYVYKFEFSSGIVLVTLLWYLAIKIRVTGIKLLKGNINTERLTGRFKGIRRIWYLFVKSIPVIGKTKVPFKALKGVSLNMETGMVGLLGPNGAGKSTIMRIICGILEQSYGKVFINGFDTQKYREELQGLIGFLPQEFGSYENMTTYEFLDYMAIIKGLKDEDLRNKRIKYVLDAVHMWERKDSVIGSFSGGMKQRVGIAQIMLHLPRILVVDEPTAGLDPGERIRFRNLLVELSRVRIVIFSTHIIEDISSSCNQVAVMSKGELKYWGNPSNLSKLAVGMVWTCEILSSQFHDFNKKYKVVHHVGIGDIVKVRVISETKPHESAIQVEPNLEDSYLWLLN